MRSLILAATALPVAVALPAHATPCKKTFTAPMIERAIDVTYAGTRRVRSRDIHNVRRFIRCARPGVSKTGMLRLRDAHWRAWRQRCMDAQQMSTGLASWYGSYGPGACGTGAQDGMAFASLFLPCGAVVRFCLGSACADGVMKDHGPYVAGRLFDLNANLASALGCGGVCLVRWRRV